ncbi:MAG: hypothetical protein ABI035_05005 [Gemmatimonadaceae bacterium]
MRCRRYPHSHAARTGARQLVLIGLGVFLLVPKHRLTAQAVTTASTTANDSATSTRIGELIQSVSYGVPASPAFELLPNKPEEVAPLVSGHDFQTNAKTWLDGTALRIGIAVDSRPFVKNGGSLSQYQRSTVRQIAFRTMLSAGTARATDGHATIAAIGVRIPLVDDGDARADSEFVQLAAGTINRVIASLPQPPLNADASFFAARMKIADKALDSLRDDYERRKWNARKLELGAAGSVQAGGTQLTPDSTQLGRAGFWLGGAVPVSTWLQLTSSGAMTWARTDSVGQESSRASGGLGLRAFPVAVFSVAVEVARVQARHTGDRGADHWTHLGTVAEWYVAELGGWLGAGYGGDLNRSGHLDRQLSLRYAFYKDRLLTQ